MGRRIEPVIAVGLLIAFLSGAAIGCTDPDDSAGNEVAERGPGAISAPARVATAE